MGYVSLLRANENLNGEVVGLHRAPVQQTSSPSNSPGSGSAGTSPALKAHPDELTSYATEEAKAETFGRVSRSGATWGITGHQGARPHQSTLTHGQPSGNMRKMRWAC
jgi:hypothetical protein